VLRDISTVQTYKTTLLNAKSIGYSHGCSGTNIAKGIDELGLTEQLKAKTVFADDRPIVEYLGVGDPSATLDITGGTFTVDGPMQLSGHIDVSGGKLAVKGSASGTGSIRVEGNGQVEFGGTSASWRRGQSSWCWRRCMSRISFPAHLAFGLVARLIRHYSLCILPS